MPFSAGSGGGATTIPVEFVDEGSADALAKELEAAITAAMGTAARSITTAMKRALSGGLGGGSLSKSTSTMQRNVSRSVATMAAAMGNLEDRVDAVNRAMRRVGGPAQELETLTRMTHVAAESFDDLKASRERAISDPRAAKVLIAEAELAVKSANTQQRTALKLTDVAQDEFKKRAEASRIADQTASQAAKREAAERIVTMQTESAREVAITKAAAQRRVEFIRAAVNQIRALERGLAAVFRATASAIAGSFRAVGGILRTATAPIRNFRSELTVGLNASLHRRESILRGSMSRQERIIQSSTVRQSVQFARLEAASSRGIAGAVTGRSQLGALLGGGLAIGGGFAVVGLLKNLATAGADFTQGLAVLDAQLGLTDRQMGVVHDKALELGNDLTLPGVSALQGAEAIQILAKQFGALGKGAVPAALAASKGVLQLSRATQSSAEDAASLVGAAVNVFGISADKAVQVADQVTGALTKAAGVGFGDFALAFKQGAAVFSQFQVPAVGAEEALVDFNVALAVLAKGGLVGSDAGTSLKQFFLQANRNTADSRENLRLLTRRAGETGDAFFDMAGKARPLNESLDIMRRGLIGLSDKKRTQVLGKIFGSDAIRAANILLSTSEKTFDSIEKGVRKSGTAAEIAAAQNQGLRGAMDALNSIIETQGILVYEKLNVILGNLVLGFADFLNQLITGEGAFATIRTALKGIALGLGGILAVKGVTEVFRFLLILARGLLTPFGLVALAAAGIGAAFTLLMENSESFRQTIGRLKDTLGEVAGTVTDFFGDLFGGSDAADALATETQGIDTRTLGEKIGDKIREMIGPIKEAFVNVGETVTEFIGDVFTGSDINDAFAENIFDVDTRTLGEKIGDKIREIFETVKRVVGGVVSNVQQLFGDLLFGTDFADALAESVSGADTRSTFEKVGGTIREAIGNIVDAIQSGFNTARDAIQSFWDVAQPVLQPAIDGIMAFAGAVGDLFKLKPSKGLLAIGGVLAGIAGGFAVAGPLGAAVGGLGAALAGVFATGLGDDLGGVLRGIGSSIVDALRGPFETVKDFLKEFFSADNLQDLAFSFFGVVERIGEILGSIVSDPRVAAVAIGLAAAAAAAAASFVKGFAQGVLENVPELAALLRDILGEAINQAFSFVGIDTDIGAPIITALALAIGGSKAIGLLTTAANRLGLATGQAIGAAVQKGTASAMTVGAAGLGGGPKGLIQGLLGGPNAIKTAGRDAGKIAAAANEGFRRNLRLIEGVGKSTFGLIETHANKGFGKALQASNRMASGIEADLGTARTAGLRASLAIQDIGTSLRQVNFRAAFDAGPIRNFRTALGALNLRNVFSGVKTGIGDLGAALKGQGRTIGAAAGTAIAGALGIAFGARMLRESKGMGDTVTGIGTILASTFAAAAIGGAPLAVFTGGLGLITTFFQSNQEAAEKAKAAVDEYAAALKGLAGAEAIGAGLTTFFDNLTEKGGNVRQTLLEMGFGAQDFVTDIVNSTGTAEEHVADMVRSFGPAGAKIAEGLEAGTLSLSSLVDMLEGGTFDPKILAFLREAEGLDIPVDDLTAALGFLDDQSTATTDGLAKNREEIMLLGQDSQFTTEQYLAMSEAIVGAAGGLKLTNEQLQFLSTVKLLGELEAGRQKLLDVDAAAQTALEGIQEVFDPALSSNLRQRLDDLITQIPGIVSALGQLDLSTIAGRAGQRGQIDSFITRLRDDLSEGIEDQEITTFPQLKFSKRQILKTFEEEVSQAVESGEISVERGDAILKALKVRFRRFDLGDLGAQLQDFMDNQPERDVDVKVRGKTQLVLDEGLRPRQMARRLQRFMDNNDLPRVNLAVNGKPVLTIEEKDKLTTRQLTRLVRNAGLGTVEPPKVEIPLGVQFAIPSINVAGARQRVRRQIRQARADLLAALPVAGIPMTIPVKPNIVVNAIPSADLATAVSDAMPTGPQGFFGEARGLGGAQSVDVPITINPVITVGGSQGGIGTGIAASIAAGITAAAPQISNALNTAIGQALRAGGQLTALFAVAGAAAAGSFASGIDAASGAASAAASRVGSAALGGFAGFDASGIGASLSGSFASGISSVSASGAASVVASGALGGFAGYSAYSLGLNLSNSLAQGILAGRSGVVNAAVSVMNSAVSAMRSAAQISSPSKVFRNIGRDVGKGFVLGIEDSRDDIVSTMEQAVQDAITAAQNKIPKFGAARAAGAAALFEATQPAAIPGGPTVVDVIRALDDASQGIADFKADLKDQVTALRQEQTEQITALRQENHEDTQELRDKMVDRIEKLTEATRERREQFLAGRQPGIDIARERINLGGLGQQFKVAFREIFSDIPKFQPAVAGESDEERAQREKENAANEQRRKDAERYAKTLNISTVAGRTAVNTFLDFGEQIRGLGQSMLDNGASVATVTKVMRGYRNELIRAAKDSGITGSALNALVRQLGLTDKQLRNSVNVFQNANERSRDRIKQLREEFQAEKAKRQEDLLTRIAGIKTLDAQTEAGRRNRAAVLDNLQAIRDFGVQALKAGTPAKTVVTRMKALRDSLIATARRAGLPTDRIKDLVKVMGLSNDQIAEFVRQLKELNKTVPGTIPKPEPDEGETPGTTPRVRLPGPLVGSINISVPYGDPEAIGLTVANRVAFFAA